MRCPAYIRNVSCSHSIPAVTSQESKLGPAPLVLLKKGVRIYGYGSIPMKIPFLVG